MLDSARRRDWSPLWHGSSSAWASQQRSPCDPASRSSSSALAPSGPPAGSGRPGSLRRRRVMNSWSPPASRSPTRALPSATGRPCGCTAPAPGPSMVRSTSWRTSTGSASTRARCTAAPRVLRTPTARPPGPCHEYTGLTSGLQPCPGCQTGYHDYSIIIDRRNPSKEQIRWYLDGKQFFSVSESTVGAAARTEASTTGSRSSSTSPWAGPTG
jgi:hypothetical protein